MQTTNLLQELREAADTKKLDFLTVDKAKALKGKRIQTIYFGYSGQDGVNDFIVGDVVSQFDLAKKDTSMKGYANRAEYWESYMSKEMLDEMKTNLGLMTEKGEHTKEMRNLKKELENETN